MSIEPMSIDRLAAHALVVVDAQTGFDEPSWGPGNNPGCDDHIVALLGAWQRNRWPIVAVHHDSTDPQSTLHTSRPGNADRPFVPSQPDLRVVKSVNSAFHGEPDLHRWLVASGLSGIVVCGFTTNHCCETTARVGANLGHSVLFALDATRTFDRRGPDGAIVTADELTRATAASLHGEFGLVVTTAELLAQASVAAPAAVESSVESAAG